MGLGLAVVSHVVIDTLVEKGYPGKMRNTAAIELLLMVIYLGLAFHLGFLLPAILGAAAANIYVKMKVQGKTKAVMPPIYTFKTWQSNIVAFLILLVTFYAILV